MDPDNQVECKRVIKYFVVRWNNILKLFDFLRKNNMKWLSIFSVLIALSIIGCFNNSYAFQSQTDSLDSAESIIRIEAEISCSMKGRQMLAASRLPDGRYELTLILPDSNSSQRVEWTASVSISLEEWGSVIRIIKEDSLLYWKPFKYHPPMQYDGCGDGFALIGKGWFFGISFGTIDSPLHGGFYKLGWRLAELWESHKHQLRITPNSYTSAWDPRYHKSDTKKTVRADVTDLSAIIVEASPMRKETNGYNKIFEEIVAFNTIYGYSMRVQYRHQGKDIQVGKELSLNESEWLSLSKIVDEERLIDWQPGIEEHNTTKNKSHTWGFVLQSDGGWYKTVSISVPMNNTNGIMRLKDRMLKLMKEREPTELIYFK